MQPLDVGGRFEPELVPQDAAHLSVGVQRLGAPPRLVQGGDQLAVEPLVERVVVHQRSQLGDELAQLPEPPHGLDPQLERPDAQLFQVDRPAGQDVAGRYVGEGRAAPQPERQGQGVDRRLVTALPELALAPRDEPLEDLDVDGRVVDVHRVAAEPGGQQGMFGVRPGVPGQQSARVVDVGLDGVERGARRAVLPQFLDEGVRRDEVVGVGEEQGQDLGDLGRSRRKDLTVAGDDLERSDEVEPHDALSFKATSQAFRHGARGSPSPIRARKRGGVTEA